MLQPIVELARERDLAVVCVQHVNRNSEATDALDRIADSQGLPQVARSVLVWGADPQDECGDAGTRKVLTRPKANLAPASAGAAASFEITTTTVDGVAPQPYLLHRGTSAALPEDVVQSAEARSTTDEARRFLVELLTAGPQPAKDVERAAEEAGIGTYALRQARKRWTRSYRPGKTSGAYVVELRSSTNHAETTDYTAYTESTTNTVDSVLTVDSAVRDRESVESELP